MATEDTTGFVQFAPSWQSLKVLRSVAEALAGPSNQRELMGKILSLLRRELGLVSAEIMLMDADGREPDIVTVSQDPYDSRKIAYAEGFEALRSRVIQTGQSVVINRIQDDSHFTHLKSPTIVDIHDQGLICLPVMGDGRAMGTLSAFAFLKEGKLLAELENIMAVTAGMIAGVMWVRQGERRRFLKLNMENLRLKKALGEGFRIESLVGESSAIRDVSYQIKQVALQDTPVMVRGEMGAGKRLAASMIHYSGPRVRRPLVAIDCSSACETLLEERLFGRERDEANPDRNILVGDVELAEGGTLLLKEVAVLPLSAQVRLIRLILDGEYQRIGAFRSRKLNVRVVATSDRDLEKAVDDGRLLPDLYELFNPHTLYLPPLRERRDDILPLMTHFIEKHSQAIGRGVDRVSPPAVTLMMDYHWPGNVREFEDCLKYAIAKASEGVLYAHHLPPTIQVPDANGMYTTGTLRTQVQRLERDIIIDTLKHYGGSVSKASQELGITARMVRYKIQNLEIDYVGMFKSTRRPRD